MQHSSDPEKTSFRRWRRGLWRNIPKPISETESSESEEEKKESESIDSAPETPPERLARRRLWRDLLDSETDSAQTGRADEATVSRSEHEQLHKTMKKHNFSEKELSSNNFKQKEKIDSLTKFKPSFDLNPSQSRAADASAFSKNVSSPKFGLENNLFFKVAKKKVIAEWKSEGACSKFWFLYSLYLDSKFPPDPSKWGSYFEAELCLDCPTTALQITNYSAAYLWSPGNMKIHHDDFFLKRRDALRNVGMMAFSLMKNTLDLKRSHCEHFTAELIWCNNSCALDAFLSLVPAICGHVYQVCPNVVISIFYRSLICSVLGTTQYLFSESCHTTRLKFSNMARQFLMDCLNHSFDSLKYLEKEEVLWSIRPGQQFLDIGRVIELCLEMFFRASSGFSNFSSLVVLIMDEEIAHFETESVLSVEVEKFLRKRFDRQTNVHRLIFIRFPNKLNCHTAQKFEALISKNWNQSPASCTSVIGMIGYSSRTSDHFVSLAAMPYALNSDSCYLHDGLRSEGRSVSLLYSSLRTNPPMKWLCHFMVVCSTF